MWPLNYRPFKFSCLSFFFLSMSLLSQTLSFWSLKNCSNWKHSLLHIFFVGFFPSFLEVGQCFTQVPPGWPSCSVKGMRITTLNMHSSPQIPFTQDDSAALWTWSSTRVLLKTCCISIWLWEMKKKQYPVVGLLQQGWFICLVIMTDLTPKYGKSQEKGDTKGTQQFGCIKTITMMDLIQKQYRHKYLVLEKKSIKQSCHYHLNFISMT